MWGAMPFSGYSLVALSRMLSPASRSGSNLSAFACNTSPEISPSGTNQFGWADSYSTLRSSIEADLTSKGFQRIDSGADFVVGYQVSTQDQVSYTTMTSGWTGGGYRWGGGWGMGTGVATTTATTTTIGTLLIGVFDERAKDVVWHGSGQKALSSDPGSPEDRARRIDDAVTKIMEGFPPGS